MCLYLCVLSVCLFMCVLGGPVVWSFGLCVYVCVCRVGVDCLLVGSVCMRVCVCVCLIVWSFVCVFVV